jgi:two-component system sensor histidine kinase/response regulator
VYSFTALRFQITDTGIGIRADAQPHLFESFTQADGSTTRKYGGTGLGLAISKRLVEMMGGSIGVASGRTVGASFWLTARFVKAAGSVATPLSLGVRRVLVIDEYETGRDILRQQLEGWGATVDTFSGTAGSLDRIKQTVIERRQFAVVIHHQPERFDGVTLARRIRSAAPTIRIVVLVPVASISEREQLSTDRIDGVSKPVKHTFLRAALGGDDSTRRPARDSAAALQIGNSPRALQRVLVVEDNIVNQRVAVQQLRRLGYTADASQTA